MKGSSLASLLAVLSLGALVVAGLAVAIDDGTDAIIRLPSEGEGVTEDGEEEVGADVRPWKCCDTPRCTRSFPPTCHCMDTVPRCYSACKSCKETRPSSHRYRCLDAYEGQPGPKCSKADDVNQSFTTDVTNDDEQEAEVAIPAVAVEKEEIAAGKRPWKCCDTPHCTRSFPPTCHCMDTVSRCYSICKNCKETRRGSHHYRCLDAYEGQPGPKCSKADGLSAVGSGD